MSLKEIIGGPLDLAAVRAYVDALDCGDGAAGAAVAERLLDELERLTGPEARERLARHLYLKSATTEHWRQIFTAAWEQPGFDRSPWYAEADEILAVAAGKEE